MIAEVILARPAKKIDKVFHYLIPEQLKEQIKVGSQVVVPFGRRKDDGFVVGFVEQSDFPGIKEIESVVGNEPVLSEKAILFAKWLADYYFSFLATALRLMIPPGKKLPTSNFQLQNKSQITINKSKIILNSEQEKALGEINEAVGNGENKTFLLYGVTGSGKTEVYLRAIEKVLSLGKVAIALVPEISLTPQLVARFNERFGDQIAVMHSDLTLKKRRSEWRRIKSGEAKIVLGARSALFAPVANLGLIVIDEEYEHSYKSDKSPRYHTREAALKLARLHNAVVVLGSATPSLETYYHCEQGDFKKIMLTKRVDDRQLPPIAVIDMRQELKKKNFSVLSERLKEEIKETLARREQIILFINRLGFFTFVMCRECGLTLECPRCSVSLVYHTGDKKLHCSKCEYTTDLIAICPRCNSSAIKYFGTGTQRIEEEVAKIFPAARILRYDRDTVSKRGSHEMFFATFAAGKADVMIGTQMVTKGLDLANVTLVGAVAADTALNLPDFRAAEHTFQLLTQVAGRAGRHHLAGKVIIQTYNPDHYAIKAAAQHDFALFYRQEIEHRRELNYPPFSKLIAILVSGVKNEAVAKTAEELQRLLAPRIKGQILGPIPAIISKLRGEWRYQLLLKGVDLAKMRQGVREALEKLTIVQGVKITVDIEPMSMI
jgi:primosomal protein N' (replication factor Y)